MILRRHSRAKQRAAARTAGLPTLACVFLSLTLPSRAWAEKVTDLKPQGYVNDFARAIDSQTSQRITAICGEVDRSAHAQIAVVTINSLDGEPVEDFAVALFKQWGIGYKGEDRGVLILLAKSDHKLKVEVGYGLEPILPDGMVGGFGRELVPMLRSGDYGAALLQDTALVAQVIAKDRGVKLGSVPMERRARPEPQLALGRLIFWGIILCFGGLLSVVRWFATGSTRRRGSWWIGPWIGGGFGGGGFGGFGGGASGGGGSTTSW